MTREEIIALAREAGFFGLEDRKTIGPWERFAALIAAHEREECAKVVESSPSYDWHKFACESAAAIRARGNHV